MNIEDVFRKLKPIMGKRIEGIWREYLLADTATKKMIEDVLRLTLARDLKHSFEGTEILLEPPSRDLARGEYPLGVVHYGRRPYHIFGLREDEFIQHTGIFGRSGSGKTNIAYLIVLNLLRKKKPFLIFDWKRNYRDLLSHVSNREILIFTVGRNVCPFYFNPLIPPKGTPATVWLKKLIEIMCHSYFLGEGVAYLMQKAIDYVYRELGVYDGQPESWPTLDNVRDWLERQKVKAKEALWMQSALRAVGVLCFGEVGRVLNSQTPVDLEGLLGKNVILELDALTNSDKAFLIEALLLWLHHYRLGQQAKEQFKHAIIIEEAHHILLRKKQEITGEEAVTDVILREIRELGEGLVLIDQHPSLISIPALANTYCTISMNLKHRADLNMVSSAMNLDPEQTKYLGQLEIGWGMTKLQGRWPKPFLVRFPLIKVEKGAITDETLEERELKSIPLNGLLRESKELAEGMKADLQELKDGFGEVSTAKGGISRVSTTQKGVSAVSPGSGKYKNNGKEKGTINLTTNDKLFLEDVTKYEFDSISERYERLNLSWREGNNIRDWLISNGFIYIYNLSTGKGRIKLLLITDKGKEILGCKQTKSDRKGSIEHRYWIYKVAEHFRKKGYRVKIEKPLNGGKTVDIEVSKNAKAVAVEVETGKSDALANIRKCLDAGFEQIISVAVNHTVKLTIQKELEKESLPLDRVKVLELKELIL